MSHDCGGAGAGVGVDAGAGMAYPKKFGCEGVTRGWASGRASWARPARPDWTRAWAEEKQSRAGPGPDKPARQQSRAGPGPDRLAQRRPGPARLPCSRVLPALSPSPSPPLPSRLPLPPPLPLLPFPNPSSSSSSLPLSLFLLLSCEGIVKIDLKSSKKAKGVSHQPNIISMAVGSLKPTSPRRKSPTKTDIQALYNQPFPPIGTAMKKRGTRRMNMVQETLFPKLPSKKS
ncbi:hypothetical protein EJ110_NYTH39875 [Nymphaea thermarum]|nr:hypothetical protein EJ110_NYTH39875 [Nymphaea thermarum]